MRILVIIAAAVTIIMLCCVWVSGRESRREEWQQATAPGEPADQADPCGTCLRLPECDGVDPDCPLREGDAYGKD